MPIDWFTVVAQVINFMILVWLLKRFLYRPILNAIDTREQGIADQLADAEAKKSEALRERDDFLSKNEKFDKERAELRKQAADETSAERQRILEEARRDADTLRVKLEESLKTEHLHLSEEIVRRAQKEIIATTRKVLADLASESLDERISEVFVLRLRELTVDQKEQLAGALKRSNDSVRVRSAFPLSPVQQSAVEKAIRDSLNSDIQVHFEIVPELVSGIELVTNGQKVAWSITDYMSTLERNLGQLLPIGATVNARRDQPAEAPRETKVMTSTAKVSP